jgi:hypothetical protein
MATQYQQIYPDQPLFPLTQQQSSFVDSNQPIPQNNFTPNPPPLPPRKSPFVESMPQQAQSMPQQPQPQSMQQQAQPNVQKPNFLNKYLPPFIKRNQESTTPMSGWVIGVVVCLIIIALTGIISAIIYGDVWLGLFTALPAALSIGFLAVEYRE